MWACAEIVHVMPWDYDRLTVDEFNEMTDYVTQRIKQEGS
jgi:hypothetical protein